VNYLLDTCVLSELVRPKPNAHLTEWLVSIPPDAAFLSVLTVGEVRKGIEKLPNSKKKKRLALWYATLLNDYRDRILPIDLAISEAWGNIQAQSEKSGTPMATIDGLLAATALVHRLLVVTRNEKDFLPSFVSILNPWRY